MHWARLCLGNKETVTGTAEKGEQIIRLGPPHILLVTPGLYYRLTRASPNDHN